MTLATVLPAVAPVATLLDAVGTPKELAEFTYYRHDLPLAHRPLEPVAFYPDEPAEITETSLRDWAASAQFRAAEAMFVDYPDRSLCRPIDRMLLYHLVRSLRPVHAVEIGTYFAAGAEVLARALWENGSGLLHTIDPYGKIRGPGLIGRWDERLRDHVRFYPWNSMEFFQHLAEKQLPLELVFVDGNHNFENALFDLESAAKRIRPGGIVVMDDANQSGPFWAAKVFLEQNPGWMELGDCLSLADSNDPFGPLPSLFEGSKFLILKASSQVCVGQLPYSTGEVSYSERQLAGLELSLVPGQTGELLGRAFLRGFPGGENPEQLQTRFRIEIRGESRRTWAFDSILRTRYSDRPQLPKQTVELVLLWRPSRGRDALKLNSAPRPISAISSSSTGQ
jgi:predicted O-methyltransferase YrrM